MTEMMEKLVEAVVLSWAKYMLSNGRDPKAELDAMLETSDATVDATEKARFPNG